MQEVPKRIEASSSRLGGGSRMIANLRQSAGVSFASISIVGNVADIDAFELQRSCASISIRTRPGRSRKRSATTHLEPAVAAAVASRRCYRKEELPAELARHVAGLIRSLRSRISLHRERRER